MDKVSSDTTNPDLQIKQLQAINKNLQRQLDEKSKALDAFNTINDILIQTIPLGIDIVDETGQILFANDVLKKDFGQDLVGKKCWEIYRNDQQQCSFCPLSKNLILGQTEKCQSDGIKGNRSFEIIHTAFMFKGKKAILEIFHDISEQSKFNRELIDSKKMAEDNARKLSGIFENMIDAFFQADANGIFTFANPSALKMYRYESIDDLIGKPASSLYADENTRIELIEELRTKGKVIDKIGQAKRKDGSTFWVSMNVQFTYDEHGTINGTEGVVRDISERRQIEEELLKSKQKFKLMLNSLPISVFLTSENHTKVDFINDSFTQIFGYTFDDIPTIAKWLELAYPDKVYRNIVGAELKQQLRKATLDNSKIIQTESQVQCKDGSIKEIFWQGFMLGDQLLGCGTDITQQRKHEQELQNALQKAIAIEEIQKNQLQEVQLSNDRLESLLRVSQFSYKSTQELLDFALTEAISLTNSKIGYIYFYNEEKKHFILNSWSKEVMKECLVTNPQTIYELDKTGCWGEAVRQRKPILLNDYQGPDDLKKGIPEGHVKLQKFLTIPVFSDDKIVAVVGVANKPNNYNDSDIRQLTLLMDTVWKIAERQVIMNDLQRAKEKAEESDRLKTSFLLNISHEIRTPMNGIFGFLNLLEDPEYSKDEKSEFIKIVNQSGERLMTTINDIVEISKIEIGDIVVSMQEFDLREVMKFHFEFFSPQAKSQNLTLSISSQVETDAAFIFSDKHKIDSILINLLKNAIKFTEKGKIEFGNYIKDNEIHLYVKDTGRGIPAEKLHLIFDRFVQGDTGTTRAYEGSGIGLSIVKAFTEALNGTISVHSEPGIGSTFVVTIPYQPTREVKSIAESNPLNDSPSDKKVIIIAEDDEVNYLFLKNILHKNYQILHAATGEEAVHLFKQHPSTALILMDIKMPGKYDGVQAAKILHEMDSSVPIIAQSAFALESDKKGMYAAGCIDYLTKPYSAKTLLEAVKKHLKEM